MFGGISQKKNKMIYGSIPAKYLMTKSAIEQKRMHPVASAFNASYESMRSFCQAMYDENQELYGREVFHYHIWAMLNDTPYTTGEVDLANWNSKADSDKGREAFK